jgi:monomeric isocitrate dehydrogenase
MSELAVMDRTGDTKTIWNPAVDAEVEVARAAFNTLKKKGYAIYSVDKDGEKNTVMHTFDPNAAKLIAIPAIVGG